MTDLLWLVPLLPFLGGAVNFAAGRRFGRGAGWLAVAVMAASFALSVGALLDLVARPAEERILVARVFEWIAVGGLRVGVDLRLDPLAATMLLVVTGVGSLIHVYAIGYMEGDPRFSRFFAYLNLFVGFMLVLVLAENLLLLYLGWEGVGLCSYLLIGFWFERHRAAEAAKKAFVTTRVGDTFLMLGIALAFLQLGSLDLTTILDPATYGAVPTGTLTAIALLLFGGAIGKSAQVPLHVWLPDAMEGPTPVSALIHAATMVTAGVYLVARTHVLFEASGVALTVVLVVGLITALYAAVAALGQDDSKRVLAYSTISQLGFMFLALGLRAYAAAIFLLVTHAFYKALLFLSAGSVMHAMHDETDVKRMGGLRGLLPVTSSVMVVGALALAGLPPFAGFFSKDQVIAAAFEAGQPGVWVLGLVGAFLSALYIVRLVTLAFAGGRRSDTPVHESPAIMTAPLVVLAVLSAAGGLLGLTAREGLLARFLAPSLGEVAEAAEHGISELGLTLISLVVASAGLAAAWWVYGSGRVDWLARRERNAPFHRFLEAGGYVDRAYARFVVAPSTAVARFSARAIDRGIVDRIVDGTGAVVADLAERGRRLQTGFVRSYALAVLLGAVVLGIYVGVRLT
ncbi:MAG: NADH-quinone oxidoreductase subunit L [Actinomycetota bacterium]